MRRVRHVFELCQMPRAEQSCRHVEMFIVQREDYTIATFVWFLAESCLYHVGQGSRDGMQCVWQVRLSRMLLLRACSYTRLSLPSWPSRWCTMCVWGFCWHCPAGQAAGAQCVSGVSAGTAAVSGCLIVQEKQIAFYKSIQGMPACTLHNVAESYMETHSVTEEYMEGGEFLPLSVWVTRGFSGEKILQNTSDEDRRHHRVLGETFRVKIVSTKKADIRTATRKSELSAKRKRGEADTHADDDGDRPRAIEDGRVTSDDDGTSDTSDSSSSSSDKKHKKHKKHKHDKKHKKHKHDKKHKKHHKKDKKGDQEFRSVDRSHGSLPTVCVLGDGGGGPAADAWLTCILCAVRAAQPLAPHRGS